MLLHHITMALRVLARQRWHVALNVFGLAVGLAAAALVIVYVRFETSYDEFLPNVDSTYRMGVIPLDVPSETVSAYASAAVQEIAASMQEVEELFALFPWAPGENDEAGEQVRAGERYVRLHGHYAATANLTEFVRLQPLFGKIERALTEPAQLALSRSEAVRLFGTPDAIGRRLIRSNGAWTVAAVFEDLPQNTHYDFRSLSSAADIPDNFFGYAYVRLRPGTNVAALAERISSTASERNYFPVKAGLHPIRALHLATNGAQTMVSLCIGLSAILIAIAALNFINMSTARAGERALEIGLRKALGASRGRLIVQHLTESVCVAIIAGVIAAALVRLTGPAFGQLLDRELPIALLGQTGLILLALVTAIGLLAGIYPALFLASFSVRRALSGELNRGDVGILVRKSLYVLQAAFSAGAIIAALVIYQQVRHLQDLPTGYSKVQRLEARGISSAALYSRNRESLFAELEQIPGVRSATVLDRSFTEGPGSVIDVVFPGAPTPITSGFSATGLKAVETLGLDLLAGRDFSRPSDWYHTDPQGVERASILITRSMARAAGFADPADALDKELKLSIHGANTEFRVTVAGVIADLKIGSAKQQQRPIFLICGFSWSRTASLILRLAGQDLDAVPEEVRRVLHQRLNIPSSDLRLTEEQYLALYRQERNTAQLVIAFSLLAIFLSCIGTGGLATWSVQRRRREFAIRRVQGASRAHLIGLLTNEYLQLVLVSSLLAFPVMYVVMNEWLGQFTERIDVSVGIFIASTIALCGTTWLAVSGLAWRAANVRPSLSLRYE